MAFIGPPIDVGWLGQPVVPQFDITRQELLGQPLQPPQVGQGRLPLSSTLSPYRVRPNAIHRWDDFPTLVADYHTRFVTQADKLAQIGTQSNVIAIYAHVRRYIISSESHVKKILDAMPVLFHEMITTSSMGQALPSDAHSQILRYDPNLRTAGWPDFVFLSTDGTRATVMMDAKNPWKVTPTSIEQVLNGNTVLNSINNVRVGSS
jgi:hypothetical protein